MSVMMLRVNVKPETVADVETAVTTMLSAIEKGQPKGVRYASCRLGDSTTFVIFLEVEEGIENPLPAVPEFRAFQENVKNWIAEPLIPDQLTVIGSYNLF